MFAAVKFLAPPPIQIDVKTNQCDCGLFRKSLLVGYRCSHGSGKTDDALGGPAVAGAEGQPKKAKSPPIERVLTTQSPRNTATA